MRCFSWLLSACLLATQLALAHSATAATALIPQVEYLSPVPGSAYLLPETNIIIRPGGAINPSSVGTALLSVTGSVSGAHEGRIRTSDDGRTVTFQAFVPFEPGEIVTCRLNAGLRTDARGEITPGEFAFSIAGPEQEGLRKLGSPSLMEESLGSAAVLGAADSLPPDFPLIHSTTPGTPEPGLIFLADLRLGVSEHQSHLMIVRDDGTPVFSRKLRRGAVDFKVQPDGRLTYYDTYVQYFYVMNALYEVIDSVRCGNGYSTDAHELLFLPNGHAILMSYDLQIVDMSTIVPGGNPAARVLGLVVQELDRERNVVFQWRSWDNFKITDATDQDFRSADIDYVHGNSIDLDTDGNLLISCRHMDEVTKISRTTGEVIWRLGGKNNQFAFVGDPIRFSHQHAVRRISNGNITLFDNGNFHSPCFSRAVEYALDEDRKIATLVWQYRHVPDVCGYALGYVQRLPGGHTLIGWGATNPTVTEVTADGTVVFELTLDAGISSYRAFRREWPPVRAARVRLKPETISAASNAPWVKAEIEPRGFDAATIDRTTVRLAGTIPAELAHGSGLRFSRRALMPLLDSGMNRLEVSGSLTTGERFSGVGELRLIDRHRPHRGAMPLEIVSAPGSVPVEFSLRGAGEGERTLAVYDIQGRLVSRWRAKPGEAGVFWDGRGTNGMRVGSGIYFARVEGEAAPAAKVIILR